MVTSETPKGTTMSTSTDLSAPSHDFLITVSDEFESALRSVLVTEGHEEQDAPEEYMTKRVSNVAYRARAVLTDMEYSPERWCRNLRFLNALRTGIADGTISCETREDIDLFDMIINIDFSPVPELAEYYFDSGEFMDVIRAVRDNTPLFFLKNRASLLARSFSESRIRMYRLYAFDKNSEREPVNKGDMKGTVDEVPLDVRLVFCGIEDEIAQEEILWSIELNNDTWTATEALSAFQMTRSL